MDTSVPKLGRTESLAQWNIKAVSDNVIWDHSKPKDCSVSMYRLVQVGRFLEQFPDAKSNDVRV